jgi:hypothetical protein
MATGLMADRIRVPWWGLAIAAFEIIGGLSCLGALATGDLWQGANPIPLTSAVSILLTLVLAVLSAGAVGAGVLLVMRRAIGWKLSRTLQAIQLVQFDILGVRFVFALGASVTVGMRSWELIFGYHFGSDAALLIGGAVGPFTLVTNAIAVVLFALLLEQPELSSRETPEIIQPAG